MSDSLLPHELQHTRPPYLSPTPVAYPNSCPLSWWCHPTISSSVVPFSSCPQSFPASGFFSNESALRIRRPKYWSFSFNIQSFQWIFRVDFLEDWLVWSPPCPSDSQESSPVPQFENINSSVLKLLFGPTLTFIHDYWKNHSFVYMDFVSKVMSLLFNMLSRFVITFLSRSKHLLI